MFDPIRSPATLPPGFPEAGGPPRLDRGYQAPRGSLRVVLARGAPLAWVTIRGQGNVAGLEALVRQLDACSALLERGERVRILVDVSGVTLVPARAPLVLGRWILGHRHQLDRAGVVVSSGIVQALTRTVFRIAGVPGVLITTETGEARRWVG